VQVVSWLFRTDRVTTVRRPRTDHKLGDVGRPHLTGPVHGHDARQIGKDPIVAAVGLTRCRAYDRPIQACGFSISRSGLVSAFRPAASKARTGCPSRRAREAGKVMQLLGGYGPPWLIEEFNRTH
jgi:hypothetical protein